jgi:phosphopantetheinyl transferase (holo-ACP synthase)
MPEEWESLQAEFWAEQKNPQGAKEKRVAAAKERHAKAWSTPAQLVSTAESEVYRMNFGKHSAGKGKTVAEVQAQDPKYFRVLMSLQNDMLAAPERTGGEMSDGCSRGLGHRGWQAWAP